MANNWAAILAFLKPLTIVFPQLTIRGGDVQGEDVGGEVGVGSFYISPASPSSWQKLNLLLVFSLTKLRRSNREWRWRRRGVWWWLMLWMRWLAVVPFLFPGFHLAASHAWRPSPQWRRWTFSRALTLPSTVSRERPSPQTRALEWSMLMAVF